MEKDKNIVFLFNKQHFTLHHGGKHQSKSFHFHVVKVDVIRLCAREWVSGGRTLRIFTSTSLRIHQESVFNYNRPLCVFNVNNVRRYGVLSILTYINNRLPLLSNLKTRGLPCVWPNGGSISKVKFVN